MAAIVEGIGLTKRFGTGDATVVAVDAVDIRIEESELVMLMGDSGCGKTTLISLLGCILTPDDGELRIDGEPIHTVSEDLSVIPPRKNRICFPVISSITLPHRLGKCDGRYGHRQYKNR